MQMWVLKLTCKYEHFRGSAIAKIVGVNAAANSKFDNTVKMWVFEEMVNGRKLTEIINAEHENVKYLPGHTLPANVVRNCRFLFFATVLFFIVGAVVAQCKNGNEELPAMGVQTKYLGLYFYFFLAALSSSLF